MNPGEAVKMDTEYKSFLAELGGGPPPSAADDAPRMGAGAPAPACTLLTRRAGKGTQAEWFNGW